MDELNTGTHCIQSTTQMFMYQRKSCCVRIQIVYWRFNAAYKEISIKLQETFLLRKRYISQSEKKPFNTKCQSTPKIISLLQKFKDIGISRISFRKLTDRPWVKANVF